ncbi:hypothetical protein [Clostridium transplantifaecale]|uniref:hypothetical protein n=1 Tax=Clostridium transplantifaecale TaxID=2479838 RepID=UPI000F6346F3|nr:hypothetical protein [Clostridium transplantifaecale]
MITTPSDYIKRLEAIQKSVTPTIEMINLGTEPLFIINTDTREIAVPPAMHQLGVVSDHNAETIYLQIDRYFDNADLSQKTCVIQYINAASEKHLYPITEKYIDEVKGKLTFAWKLSGNVTKASGFISFSVRFYEIENDAYLYNFNTKTASFMISDGLDIREDISIAPSPTDIIILVEHLDQVAAQTASDANQTSEDRFRVESLVESAVQTITDKKDGAVKDIHAATSNQLGVITSEGVAQINKIQQKGNETLESIPNDYIQISNDVSELKHKDIRNSSIYSNALIGEVTGEEQVVISDAANATIPYLEVDGVSEQVVTTGAQLFDDESIVLNERVTKTSQEYIISPTDTDDAVLSLPLPVSKNVATKKFTVTFYAKANKSGTRLMVDLFPDIISSDAILVLETEYKKYTATLTVRENDSSSINFRMFILKSSGITVYIKKEIILNEGDTAQPWEPYTGGKPSPSPDYPQEIVSVAHVAISGAQLLDYLSLPSTTMNGITFTPRADGTVSAVGLATDVSAFDLYDSELPPGTYYISGCPTGGTMETYQIIAYKKTSGIFTILGTDTEDGAVFNVVQGDNIVIRIVLRKGTSGTIIFRPMLNAGATPKSWEPYNGQQREIDLEVESKGANLLAYPYDDKIKNTSGVTFTPAEDGRIVIGGTATEHAYFYICQNPIQLNAGNYVLSGGTDGAELRILKSVLPYESIAVSTNGKEVGFTLEEQKTVIIDIVVHAGKSISTTLYPMLIVGSMPLPWEPYHYQKVTIPLTEPIRGIGDVKDRFSVRDGVWGIERNIAKVDNSQWKIRNIKDGNKGHRFAYVSDSIPTFPNFKVQSTKYRQELKSSFEVAGDYISTDEKNTHAIFIRTLEKDFETEAEFCEWMTDAETIYSLATPTWEPFPESIQAALNALTTHPGTTYLTVTSTDISAPIRLEYVQDINKVITQLYTTINELKASLAK